MPSIAASASIPLFPTGFACDLGDWVIIPVGVAPHLGLAGDVVVAKQKVLAVCALAVIARIPGTHSCLSPRLPQLDGTVDLAHTAGWGSGPGTQHASKQHT